MSSHVGRRGRPLAGRSEDHSERQAVILERVCRPRWWIRRLFYCTPGQSLSLPPGALQAAWLERAAAPKKGNSRRPSQQQQAVRLEKEAAERRCELRALVAASPLLSALLEGAAAAPAPTAGVRPGQETPAAHIEELRSQIEEHALAAGILLARDGSSSSLRSTPRASESSSPALSRRGSTASCSSAGSGGRGGGRGPAAGCRGRGGQGCRGRGEQGAGAPGAGGRGAAPAPPRPAAGPGGGGEARRPRLDAGRAHGERASPLSTSAWLEPHPLCKHTGPKDKASSPCLP